MISNIQVYLQQIKEMNLLDLVQSQNYQIISDLILIYDSEGSKQMKINFVNEEGFSALHKACIRGIPEIVELLLRNGANPNVRNIGGETPAHFAARRGSPVILHILRSYEADVQQLDDKGQSIAHNAVMSDSVLVLLWIETSTEISLKSRDSSGLTPVHLACVLGKVNCLKFFLRRTSIDIRERTKQRENCLHLVIKHGQLQCISLLLFHQQHHPSSRRSILCANPEQDWAEEKTSILTEKNSENKTAADLYNELPKQVKDKNSSFTYLFVFLRLTTLRQMKLNLLVYRFVLFFFPFLSFLVGIALAHLVWPSYRAAIYPVTSAIAITFVCSQSHRISRLDDGQNPIFAGAFLSGVVHDLLCFRVNIYPSMRDSGAWELIAAVILVPLFVAFYGRLVLVHAGRLELTEVATTDFSAFLTAEISRLGHGDPQNAPPPALDQFCQVCEMAPSVRRVKHCKLCNVCVVNIDHHCLFLMKCIARNNTRNFIGLVAISVSLIALFLWVSLKTIIVDCGPLTGASPLPYVYCAYTKHTWISTGIAFNAVSWLWAVVMLYGQLRAVSYHSTYYYYHHEKRQNSQHPLTGRLFRVLYFLVKGRYYISSEERRVLANI